MQLFASRLAVLTPFVFALGFLPAEAASLCLGVRMNEAPVGAEGQLRLSARGIETRSLRPIAGQARFDGVADGSYRLSLDHPEAKRFQTRVTIAGNTGILLDCGHADEWSGCTVKPLAGGCG